MDNYITSFDMPDRNLTLNFGKGAGRIVLCIAEEYTLIKRFKWWLFCKVFPFEAEFRRKK